MHGNAFSEKLDEKRLREIFAKQGQVTDVKIMKTKCALLRPSAIALDALRSALQCIGRDGRSRKFGFVGFSSPQQANVAVKYFNKSFIDTSRVQVEIALPVSARAIRASLLSLLLDAHHS
jgi:multiple RNA-binding domain-containing protein 1